MPITLIRNKYKLWWYVIILIAFFCRCDRMPENGQPLAFEAIKSIVRWSEAETVCLFILFFFIFLFPSRTDQSYWELPLMRRGRKSPNIWAINFNSFQIKNAHAKNYVIMNDGDFRNKTKYEQGIKR